MGVHMTLNVGLALGGFQCGELVDDTVQSGLRVFFFLKLGSYRSVEEEMVLQ